MYFSKKVAILALLFATLSGTAYATEHLSVADTTATDGVPKREWSRAEIRRNRGLSNLKNHIIPKGQWVVGGTFSYSTHSNDGYKLLVVEGIESEGHSFNLSPVVGYSLMPNSIIGGRLGYSRSFMKIDAAELNLGEGDGALNFSVDYYYMLRHSYSVAAIWRQYIPLGMNKRFAIFTEMQLAMGGSQSKFAEGNPIRGTFSKSFDISLGVNPGFVAFLTNHMAVEINIGALGVGYSHTKQIHNQVTTGETKSASISFKVNLLSIGLGLAFYF